MTFSRNHLSFPERARPAVRALLALGIFVFVVVPVLDLGWNEPALDESQGARCQLHANPAIGLEPVSPVGAAAAESVLPRQPLGRLPLISSSIFVPPRA